MGRCNGVDARYMCALRIKDSAYRGGLADRRADILRRFADPL